MHDNEINALRAGNATRADAKIGNGREEPQSIKDDLVQRLYSVDTTLAIINERLGYLADRIMDRIPKPIWRRNPKVSAR